MSCGPLLFSVFSVLLLVKVAIYCNPRPQRALIAPLSGNWGMRKYNGVGNWKGYVEPGKLALDTIEVNFILQNSPVHLPEFSNLVYRVWDAQLYISKSWVYGENMLTYRPMHEYDFVNVDQRQFVGSCTDYAKTMATIARSIGVPVRITAANGHAFMEMRVGKDLSNVVLWWNKFVDTLDSRDTTHYQTIALRGNLWVRRDHRGYYWMLLENNGSIGRKVSEFEPDKCVSWVSLPRDEHEDGVVSMRRFERGCYDEIIKLE